MVLPAAFRQHIFSVTSYIVLECNLFDWTIV